ncbi:hypothetical protein [Acinetobacter johnsonii]|uniref:hypothetical protein n=1 Tax=Acinetobacter TaxID=469 RepID=UPI003F576472
MIKAYLNFFLLALVSFSLYAKTPTFQDYPAQTYIGKNQPLKLTAQSRKYRTLFKQMSQQSPNLAGQYVMETVGCGGGCSFALIYNAKTGQGFLLPDKYTDCHSEQKGFTANDIIFQKNSQLVIAIGSRYSDHTYCETVYYLVEQNRFKQISKTVK